MCVCLPKGRTAQTNVGQILICCASPPLLLPSPSSRSGTRAAERRGGGGCQKDTELNEAWVKIPVMCSLLSGFLSPFDQGWERERRGRQLGADPGSARRKET